MFFHQIFFLWFFRAHEGYLDQGIMVKDPKLLRQNYMKKRQMKLDLLSLLPTDLAYLFFDNTCHEVGKNIIFWKLIYFLQMMPCLVIVRINRLLRWRIKFLNDLISDSCSELIECLNSSTKLNPEQLSQMLSGLNFFCYTTVQASAKNIFFYTLACTAKNICRIGKVILYTIIIIHWNACVYFSISYVIGISWLSRKIFVS